MLRALVEAARGGDHAAFEQLMTHVLDRSYATALWILRDQQSAEDAVQEAMIRAWRDLPALRDAERFEAWLRRLVVHACFDEGRRMRRWRTAQLAMPRSTGYVDDASAHVAERDAVQRVLSDLSAMHRAALVLRHALGLSVPDVAQAMGIPLGTAKSRLYHAERRLRSILSDRSADDVLLERKGRP
jgi:RNA polymerase sigma-70 factor (ECF subfamily)